MRSTLRWLTLMCLTSLLLSACGLTRTPPQPLRLGLNIWPGIAPFYAAASRQLYGSTQVEVKTFSSLYDADRAFSQGNIDVLATTFFDALRLADEGVPLKIVMATDYSNGADGIVAHEPITSISALKGKRVAVEIGAINHFIFLAALDKAGLKEGDVELVNLSVEEGARAFAQGKVDAAALWEPFLSQQTAVAGAHKLFTSQEIPGEVVDVVVVRKDLAEQRPDDIANLIAGWEKAMQTWKTQPKEIMEIMAQAMSTTPESLQSDLSGLELVDLAHNSQLFDSGNQQQSFRKAYAATATFLTQHQLLKKSAPDAAEVLDPKFVAMAQSK